ncbi:hypothetical protein Pmani_022417 [Petrolisthes manimaculis]|uniref:Uncharacterized protein n=1 Tax=Petrolisthes manimaculis TaxID=1843537 RepID=A0AAE1PEE2_9EUCA|nr:hypothetical protein Pmani_022417 [Petrolisthes manimaculis]
MVAQEAVKGRLSSSSYGSSRYGSYGSSGGKDSSTSGVPSVSYRAAVTRDLSAAQDRLASGYGSDASNRTGYGSATGSGGYGSTSRYRDNNKTTTNTSSGISSLASKFGDTTPTIRSRSTATTPTTPTTTTSNHNSTANSSSSYTSRLSSYDRPTSGYASDAKSGYGSDASRSGYASGYGSGSGSRYSNYTRSNSFLRDTETGSTTRPSYSRENSYLGSDTGSGGGWRSRVYGGSTPTTPTSPTTPSYSSLNSTSTRLGQDSRLKEEKEVKGLTRVTAAPTTSTTPTISTVTSITTTNGRSNKAPADFSSAVESSSSDDDEEVPATSKTTSTAPSTTSTTTTTTSTTTRPFRYLGAAPSLPSKPTTSVTDGMVSPPSFKYSSRFATPSTEILKNEREAEESGSSPTRTRSSLGVTETSRPKSTSPLPPRSPVPGSGRSVAGVTSTTTTATITTTSNSGIGNKECRKSVLNMDINPADSEAMRRQQEEKREELRRLRRMRGTEDDGRGKKPPAPTPTIRSRAAVAAVTTNHVAKPQVQEEAEEDSSSEEEQETKTEVKPPVPPPVEKTSSRSKVERKHSKGKSDAMRRSGSFRRFRKSSHTSKTSSSSSTSSSDSDSEVPVVTLVLRPRRRQSSRDDVVASGGEGISRSSSRTSPRILHRGSSEDASETHKQRDGQRSRTGSSSALARSRSRNNSRSSVGEGEKSRSSSRNSLLAEKKLSLGPDIDIGEGSTRQGAVRTTSGHSTAKTRSGEVVTRSGSGLHRRPTRKSSSSSSSDTSSTTSDSSDSEGEEGQFFSLAKSRSIKKSRSGLSHAAASIAKLGTRTSPDGADHVSRANSAAEIPATTTETTTTNNTNTTTATTTQPEQDNDLEPFEWPVDNSASKTDLAKLYKKYDPKAASSSSVKQGGTSRNTSQADISKDSKEDTELEPFDWPEGSPELPRKQPAVDESSELVTFEWPEGSPEPTPKKPTEVEEEQKKDEEDGFAWPEGSPELPRRNVYKSTYDSETETDLNWSDENTASQMPCVTEETEEEVADDTEYNFEWPSSPELPRRRWNDTSNFSDAYDTQADTEGGFEWPSSPEIPKMKDPKFISFTEDIDSLLNTEINGDDFDEMEKLMGYAPQQPTSVKEEDQEKDDEDEEEKSKASEHAGEEETGRKLEEEGPQKKESLKERARRNLSLFIGKLTNIDDILGSVLQPITATPTTTKKNKQPTKTNDEECEVEEVEASQVKVHDAQANRAHIDEHVEEIDPSAVIIREKEKREALTAEIITAVKAGVSTNSFISISLSAGKKKVMIWMNG